MSYMSRLKTLRAVHPPRVLIYGLPGMGKTTLASEFPNPVFLQVEDGTPAGLELTGFRPETFDDVIGALSEIYSEDHDFRTIVVDSIDKMQPLLWDAVCRENNWPSIEAPSYGKGYVATEYKWREFLEGLNALRVERGMNVVLVSHADIEIAPDPMTQGYPRYNFRLHKSGRKLVEDEMDCIFLVNNEASVKEEDQGFKKRVHAEGSSQRFIYCEVRPAFVAKNRYGMPPKIVFRPGHGYAELSKFFPAQAAPVPQAA